MSPTGPYDTRAPIIARSEGDKKVLGDSPAVGGVSGIRRALSGSVLVHPEVPYGATELGMCPRGPLESRAAI